jgi:hypothetical protein
MSELVTIIIFTVLLLSVFFNYEGKYGQLTEVISKVDKETYLVRNQDDKEAAANLLAEIRRRLTEIVNLLAKDEPDDERTKLLVKNFKPSEISESLPNTNYTSYSVNKGDKIVFCLRGKNDTLMDINTMMFVAIHELAHVGTKSIGHTDEFWDNMKWLLQKGIKYGLYRQQDFKNNPVDYCGIKITDSPLQ